MRTLDNSTLVRVCRVNDIDTAEIMDQWIKEHCKGDIRILGGPTQQELDVLFELEKEAMLFKLRWL